MRWVTMLLAMAEVNARVEAWVSKTGIKKPLKPVLDTQASTRPPQESSGPSLQRSHPPTTRTKPNPNLQRRKNLSRTTPGTQQLGALVLMPVVARRRQEREFRIAEDAAQIAFLHGWLLFVGRWNYPNVIQTLS
ncbi:hypothetical protein GCM10010435_38600 [Winogradskya consettensis]